MHIPYISVQAMTRIDELAVKHFGVEVVQMMEHAGRAVADMVRDMVGIKGKTIAVLAGKGNNGGDGLVAARFLTSWGAHVNVFLPSHPDEMKPLVRNHLGTLRSMHVNRMSGTEHLQWELALKQSHLVVDALLGYNLQGDPRGMYKDLIDLVNASGKRVLAVDCPSGLDSDSGEAGEPCISATATLALTLPKRGLFRGDGPEKSGKIFVADMGVPYEVYDLMDLSFLTGEVPRIFEKKAIVKL